MGQNTETIHITETQKTISLSFQISYEQILDLALQLTKENKEDLMNALGESLVREEKEKTVERQEEKTEKEDKEENHPWLDKDFYKFTSTTVEKINAGEFSPKRLSEEQIEQLSKGAKEAWKDDPIRDEELNQQIKEHL